MMQKIFGIHGAILWIIGGQMVCLLCNFLLLKILTVNLEVSDYGYYTLWLSIMLFIRQVIFDPISMVSAKESIKTSFLNIANLSALQIVNWATDRVLVLFCLLGIFVIAFERYLYGVLGFGLYVFAGAVYLASNGAQGVYLNILNIQKKRKLGAIGVSLDSVVKLGLVSLIIIVFDASIVSAVLAVAASSFLVFFLVRSIAKKCYRAIIINSSERSNTIKSLLVMSLPLAIPTLLVALKNIGDKVFVASFIGVEELAAYNVLLQLGFVPMVLVVGIIQTYVSPDIYKFTSNEANSSSYIFRYIGKILIFILGLIGIVVALSFGLSDFVFLYFVGPEYSSYSNLLPFFIVAGGVSGVAGILNVAVIGLFNSKTVGVLIFVSVVLSFGLFIVLILIYNFDGVVVGLVFSSFAALMVFGLALWMLPFEKNKKEYINR
jgi:O-antigen/teichoic acid export membrane protein